MRADDAYDAKKLMGQQGRMTRVEDVSLADMELVLERDNDAESVLGYRDDADKMFYLFVRPDGIEMYDSDVEGEIAARILEEQPGEFSVEPRLESDGLYDSDVLDVAAYKPDERHRSRMKN